MVRRRSSGSTTQQTPVAAQTTKTNGIEATISPIGPSPAKRLRTTRSIGKEEKNEENMMRIDEKDEIVAEDNEKTEDKETNEEIATTSINLADVEIKMENKEEKNETQKRMAAQQGENPYAKILEKPTWVHPQWSEPFRGILITLVDQRGVAQLQPTSPQILQAKEIGKNMIKFKSIAELLGDGMKCSGLTENVILEKWAWLCEMNYRSQVVARTIGMMRWRFSNAMKPVPTQDNVFIGIISEDRFDHLCELFETTEQDNLMRNEYRQIVNDLSSSVASQLRSFSSVPPTKPMKESPKATKFPQTTNGHSTMTLVHQDPHEPTVREALNARRVKQITEQKKAQIVKVPIAQNDLDVAEFERLCGTISAKDSKIWTRTIMKSLLNELKATGKSLDETTTKELTNLAEKLQKEHNAQWLTAEECHNRLMGLRVCAAKLALKPKLQLGVELQNVYTFLQSANNKIPSTSPQSNHGNEASSTPPNVDGKEVKREVETDATSESIQSSTSQFPIRSLNLVDLINTALHQSNPTATTLNGESVWVPPREEEVAAGVARSTATATATVMVKGYGELENQNVGPTAARSRGRASTIGSSLAVPILSQPIMQKIVPHVKPINHQQPASSATIFAANPAPTVDKWNLLGQLITEQARELERTKGMGVALQFQKALTDLLAAHYK
ncbi:unnamed protein product, partial [Mesorhabditis belari]|uniref:Uncharacterized protein n=1 Tax=Mesorhabditis belari TaxID=2138241 RepID=A0AAF3FLV1_9BILA